MRSAAVLGVALLGLTACGGEVPRDPAANPDDGPAGTLTVFAAASLTDAFEDLGGQLTAEHPDLDVRFTFAGSSTLAAQVLQGAPADVFAAADEVQMDRVVEAGLTDGARIVARNALVLAVPVDNPGGIEPPRDARIPGLADLLAEELTVAVCAPEVPCGAAAAEVLSLAGLAEAPDTYEADARAVLTKVQLGEVDAGLVYRSDAVSAGDGVLAFAFTESAHAVNRYPIAVLAGSGDPGAARAFVDLVLSDAGQQALRDAGFQPP